MHYFSTEMAQMEVGSVAGFLRSSQAIYEENVGAYVKLVLRRPFAKIIVSINFYDANVPSTVLSRIISKALNV